MDKQFGEQIQGMLAVERPDVPAVLDLIGGELKKDAREAIRCFVAVTEAVVRVRDLRGAIACVAFYDAHGAELREGSKGIDLAQMREVVRRSASTTDEKLFVDSIGLNSAIAKAIVARLSVLLALKPGVYVSSQSWGFGQVQSLDTFYGKVIIDFEGKKGHAMSLAVAGQNLSVADEGHLMTRYLKNREEIQELSGAGGLGGAEGLEGLLGGGAPRPEGGQGASGGDPDEADGSHPSLGGGGGLRGQVAPEVREGARPEEDLRWHAGPLGREVRRAAR